MITLSDQFVILNPGSPVTYKLRSTGHISSTKAREIVPSVLDSIGLDKSKFGLCLCVLSSVLWCTLRFPRWQA